jgi:hypothetical protein
MQRVVAKNNLIMKKIYLYLFFIAISFCSLSQYNLTEAELTNGFYYLRDNAGFKNPSSVKYNSHTASTKKFEKECFTWVKYDISAQNGFGGYARDNYIVYFYGGKPMHIESSSGVYFMFPNNDKVADQVIEWATAMGKFPGECAIEIEKKQKEEAEKKRLEEERIKLENQKKDADKTTLLKINDLISKNSLEDAAKEYSKLNFVNSEMKGILQQKLEDKFGQELDELNTYNVDDYIKANKSKLNSINPGNYKIYFDKNGISSNVSFPSWSNVPKKVIASFTVKLKSETEISIVLKDSILVSSTYSTSNTKPLFIDKNENFYFKTKTGLPVATISNDPSIDKKLIRINKVYKREKYANGILIDSQEFKTEKTVGIMKKDQ